MILIHLFLILVYLICTMCFSLTVHVKDWCWLFSLLGSVVISDVLPVRFVVKTLT